MKRHYYIEADEVQRGHLKTHFNVAASTVLRALNYQNNSTLARSIRTYAVNFLGCRLNDNLSLYL